MIYTTLRLIQDDCRYIKKVSAFPLLEGFLYVILIPEVEVSTSMCFISMKLHSSFIASCQLK